MSRSLHRPRGHFERLPPARWVVVHAGRRDEYQVAEALHEQGRLDRLVTDFYTPDLVAAVAKHVRLLQPLLRYRASGISSRSVRIDVVTAAGRMLPRLVRIDPAPLYPWLERRLSRRAATYLASHGRLGVVCYSYYWSRVASSSARSDASPALVFQVHPLARQIRPILQEDRSRTGLTYGPEPEETLSQSRLDDEMFGLHQADHFISASTFTARGLIDAGIPSPRVSVVPYGVRSISVPSGSAARRGGGQPLRVLWVGQLSYRKGLHHLLHAITRLPRGAVQLTIVSRTPIPDALARWMPDEVRVLASVDDAERDRLYRSHDLFAMPSLVEGFGLVYLEALAQGLPVLCTPNSGGPDIISDGLEGFIVPAGSPEAIAAALSRCLDERDLLPRMSVSAQARASEWGWDRFRRGVRDALSMVDRRPDLGRSFSPPD